MMKKLGRCRGMKLKWWIRVKKKCSKAYGSDSRWDRNRLNGKCAKAWRTCNTGFYAVCCTRPTGPKTMEAYCEQKEMTQEPTQAALLQGDAPSPAEGASDNADKTDDKACEVEKKVKGVSKVVEEIKATVKLMDTEAVVDPEPKAQVITITRPAEYAAPAPAPMTVVVAQGPAIAPPGIVVRVPATSPIVKPTLPTQTHAVVYGPQEPNSLEQKCEQLQHLCKQATQQIDGIKEWAQRDGVHGVDGTGRHGKGIARTGPQEVEAEIDEEVNPENPEAKDPDLVFSVKGVVAMGNKLANVMKMGKFCNKAYSDDEDDDDDDAIEEDLEKNPTDDWVSDEEEEDDDQEDEEPDATKVNTTVVLYLLEWETDMGKAVTTFETEGHPHGYKWWRYRYEYTVIESMVLAFSVLLKFFLMWLIHGVAVRKFYQTGIPERLYRYAWAYFVFHSVALMIMVSTAYMLYVPWGKVNIFNLGATAFHDFVDGRANVPYLGYSWLMMVLDVQFQLFCTFALYTLFTCFVAKEFMQALRDWKDMAEHREDSYPSKMNEHLYNYLDDIMKRRVANTASLRTLFERSRLRIEGVKGLEFADHPEDWHDFRLHLYLTEGLGKAIEHLVEVSLATNLCLAGSALLVAFLAHHFQVAFMYFLPGFTLLGIVTFVFGYFASRHFARMADNDNHTVEEKYVTLRTYTRAVQIVLYCIFFSYVRLLLSNDIFMDYPMTYLAALVGLLAVVLALALFSGKVIKETACALMLPPHIGDEKMSHYLQHVKCWHTREKCHECGAEQHILGVSFCKEWAGNLGEKREPLQIAASVRTKSFSFRPQL
jgi:hypothetical protein